MSNTIKIKSYVDVQEEYEAAGAFSPGYLVKVNSDGKVVVSSTAAEIVLPMFAVEDEFLGKSITEAYASGDKAQIWIPTRGDVVYAVLKKGKKVAVGGFLESAGDGTLQQYTTGSAQSDGGAIVGVALEALDLTATTTQTATHIKVRIK